MAKPSTLLRVALSSFFIVKIAAASDTELPPRIASTEVILLGRLYEKPTLSVEGRITRREDVRTVLDILVTRARQPTINPLYDTIYLVFLDSENNSTASYALVLLGPSSASLQPVEFVRDKGKFRFVRYIEDEPRIGRHYPRIRAPEVLEIVKRCMGDRF